MSKDRLTYFRKIIISPRLHKIVMEKTQCSHMETDNYLQWTQEYAFWPEMKKAYIEQCNLFTFYDNYQQKTDLAT